jgi:hypothetical protein
VPAIATNLGMPLPKHRQQFLIAPIPFGEGLWGSRCVKDVAESNRYFFTASDGLW